MLAIDVNNNAGRNVLGGIFKFISSHFNWKIQLHSCQDLLSEELVRKAEADGFDGIVTNHLTDKAATRALVRTPLPVSFVSVDSPLLRKRTHATAFVDNRNDLIGQLGAQRFRQLGTFKSYAFVAYPKNPAWSKERERGFVGKLNQHGIEVAILREPGVKAAVERMPKPAAVMAAWDYKAIEILEFARASGIAVPGQLAVIGVDADPILCNFTRPPLTSVEPDFERLGYCAAAALDAMMAGRKTSRTNFIYCRPKGLLERASTRYLPPSAVLISRAMAIIERDAVHGLTVQDLALRLGVSKQLLSLRFRQFENRSVRDAILDTKLAQVKEMLGKPHANLTTIAHECGFNSANRISHLFKQRIGMSASAFARQSLAAPPKRKQKHHGD